jgi:predicted transcriptional regulator
MKNEKYQPAEFELQVLGVLWEHGPSTVREVLERLPDGKPRAYTSVLSVMQVMQKKGLRADCRSDDEKSGQSHLRRRPGPRRAAIAFRQ